MEKYYETSRSFEEHFPYNYLVPNCETVTYIPHDYYTDPTHRQLNDSSEFELVLTFLSFFRKVIYIHYLISNHTPRDKHSGTVTQNCK